MLSRKLELLINFEGDEIVDLGMKEALITNPMAFKSGIKQMESWELVYPKYESNSFMGVSYCKNWVGYGFFVASLGYITQYGRFYYNTKNILKAAKFSTFSLKNTLRKNFVYILLGSKLMVLSDYIAFHYKLNKVVAASQPYINSSEEFIKRKSYKDFIKETSPNLEKWSNQTHLINSISSTIQTTSSSESYSTNSQPNTQELHQNSQNLQSELFSLWTKTNYTGLKKLI